MPCAVVNNLKQNDVYLYPCTSVGEKLLTNRFRIEHKNHVFLEHCSYHNAEAIHPLSRLYSKIYYR